MSEIHDELWLRSPSGVLQLPGVPVTAFDWTLEENTFGVLHASGPLNEIDPALFALDARFEVHRFLDGQPLGIEGDTQFLLRWWDYGDDDNGTETWRIEAYTPEYMLTGRIIDSWASKDANTNALTTKNDQGDDMMKEFVDENIGPTTATAARKCTELTIDADLALSTTVDKSAAWDNLFAVLQDLAADEYYRGEWLSFGMVASGSGTGFVFRTYYGQRGVDHTAGTANAVIVSKSIGNLRVPRTSHDHRNEYTAIRALGKGESRSRWTVRVEDTTRSAASPNAYREGKVEDTQIITTAGLTALANAALAAARPIIGFTGKLVNVDQGLYGIVVKYGDLVTAEYQGSSFPCRLSRVSGSWTKDNGEELDIDLQGSVQ